MKKRFLLSLAAVSLAFAGCGPSVMTNPGAKFPLPVTDKAPAFLFPINLSHSGMSGNPTTNGIAVTAGIAVKFGKTVISGQQLFDLVGNLSWELAEAISAQAKAQSWVLSGGAEPIASGLANMMTTILGKLAAMNLIPAGYKFKYIIALHSHGGPGLAPKTVKMDSWGGIYDVETKQILSYIESSDTMLDDENAAKVLLPNAYNGIITHLLKGE